jgi:hypothetical protein
MKSVSCLIKIFYQETMHSIADHLRNVILDFNILTAQPDRQKPISVEDIAPMN